MPHVKNPGVPRLLGGVSYSRALGRIGTSSGHIPRLPCHESGSFLFAVVAVSLDIPTRPKAEWVHGNDALTEDDNAGDC